MLIVVGRPVYALMLDKTSQEVEAGSLQVLIFLLASTIISQERVIRRERRDRDLHYLGHLSNTAYIVVPDIRCETASRGKVHIW